MAPLTPLTLEQERLELLRRTVTFAISEIPYYRRRAAQYQTPVLVPEDLARLPLVEPDELVRDPSSFCSSDQWPTAVSFSSATTGPLGRARWHSTAELEALSEHDVLSEGPGTCLIIHPFDQSPPLTPPGQRHRVYAPFLVPWHREYILRLLEQGWPGPGGPFPITDIMAFSPGLRILTLWLEDRGIDPGQFGIRTLEGYGSIQSRAWRRRLEQTWGARYQDTYGLSEVKESNASICPLCHSYHFLRPVVAEVLHPRSRLPLREGVGVLVLSELYPYAQLQILLRYWTGDLVEITRACMLSPLAVRFRGRLADSVLLGDGHQQVAIGALQVGEICSELPEVACGQISWAPSYPDVGAPLFQLETLDSGARVTVELRFPPELYPAAAERLRERLAQSLGAQISGLQQVLDAGDATLEVETVGPLKLREATKV